MTYHPIKFGCKNISSSADMVETVIFVLSEPSLWPWTWRQQTNLLAWHFGKFGYRRFSSWGDISQFIGILNLFCNLYLDHNTATQSFHKTIHFMMVYHQTKFSCKRISSADNILKSHILIISYLTVTLTLKTANQSFWKTSWLQWCITIPSLVVKVLVIQKISSGQTFIDILKFCSDLDHQNNNSVSP